VSASGIILATRSLGKLRELRALFGAAGYSVMDLREAGVAASAEEDGIESVATFEENALAKARYFHRLTGAHVVADDSGLEVTALGGRPGVHSKRWSGRGDLMGQALDDANNARLLAELSGVQERRARYICVAAYVDDRGELSRAGSTEGLIIDVPRGANGFGYDPYFYSVELGETFGEAGLAAKEGVSHRGRAFRALIEALRQRR
jgi:XTP/dITP diphosphohydrolase